MPCGTKLSSNKNAKSGLTLTPDKLDYKYIYIYIYIYIVLNLKEVYFKLSHMSCCLLRKRFVFRASSVYTFYKKFKINTWIKKIHNFETAS